MDESTTTIRVPRAVRDRLKELGDGRPLGVTLERLVLKGAGGLPAVPDGAAKTSTSPAGEEV